MYGHIYSKSMDQPGKVANPARGLCIVQQAPLKLSSTSTYSTPVVVVVLRFLRSKLNVTTSTTDWQPMKNSETTPLFSSRSQMSAEVLNN